MSFRTDYIWSGVIDPMTDEEARVWIDALRSGKYKQGRLLFVESASEGTLYCCLGVAKEVLHLPVEDGAINLAGAHGKWLSLPSRLQGILMNLNDDLQASFLEIADFLEKGFFGADKAI